MTVRTLAHPSCRLALKGVAVALLSVPICGLATPLSPATQDALSHGKATLAIIEVDATAVDEAAQAERARRHLRRDDSGILALRAQGYAGIKAKVEAAVAAPDAVKIRDYAQFPLTLWRLSSLDALQRLQRRPEVRQVHENIRLHPVSVNDLSFIDQPQAAAEGATGTGTTIAVIDGGLGTNYLSYSDFGTCTAVATPVSTCRVVYNDDFYPGQSQETVHGTNVSAIALGVAPGANLAMFDVFDGTSATSADILTAMNYIVKNLAATNNVVAINLSLGDGSSHSTQCSSSVFASAISNAYAAGILTVVAAGNSGSKTGLADPACAPDAVSVGAVYNASYGTVSWVASADTNSQCTDTSAADLVTCFSQSASYLSLLAPGSFVNAPNSSFQQSGTSQATPHVSGSIAVLRALYPAESPGEAVQRLQLTGVLDTDPGNGLAFPRINLLAAANQGTSVSLSGSGPTKAVANQPGTYSITVTNSGPLAATSVRLVDTLPSIASYVSASSGCSLSGAIVTCAIGTLASGASVTITIAVNWTSSGSVYDSAAVTLDQTNTATKSQQSVAFGTADVPLPLWAYALLGIGLFLIVARTEGRREWLPDE